MRKMLSSTYFKTALTIIVAGAILILFRNWVGATDFNNGFSKINNTMMPIYIGCFIAFIMCPIYNAIVKYLYRLFSGRAVKGTDGDVSVGGGQAVSGPARARANKTAFRTSRIIASVVCFFIIVAAIFLVGYFILPQIVESVVSLIETMPDRMAAFSAWSESHLSNFPQVVKAINNIANSGVNEVVEWVQEHLLSSSADRESLAQLISTGVLSVVNAFIDVIVGILISMYLLNYKEQLFAISRKLVSSMTSEQRARGITEFMHVFSETFIGFIVGRILDALVIGMMTYIVLRIFGISMPLLIATIVGVTNVIPFFGPFLGAIPSIFLLLLEDPMQALWFIIIILVIQQLDGNVIGPRIVGGAIGIPSFWILVAVLIGGGLFGFLGMFLGVPIFVVIYRYVDRGAIRRLKKRDKPVKTGDYYNLDAYDIGRDDMISGRERKQERTDG